MSTREEVSDGIQRDIRTDVISPVELEDYLPGHGIVNDIPGRSYTNEELYRELTDLESEVDELAQTMHGGAVAMAMPILNEAQVLSALINGDAANSLEEIEKTTGKLGKKLDDGASDTMFEIYGKMVDMGFAVPSMDQVNFGNTTGDYIGSMGAPPGRQVDPPLPPLPPIPPIVPPPAPQPQPQPQPDGAPPPQGQGDGAKGFPGFPPGDFKPGCPEQAPYGPVGHITTWGGWVWTVAESVPQIIGGITMRPPWKLPDGESPGLKVECWCFDHRYMPSWTPTTVGEFDPCFRIPAGWQYVIDRDGRLWAASGIPSGWCGLVEKWRVDCKTGAGIPELPPPPEPPPPPGPEPITDDRCPIPERLPCHVQPPFQMPPLDRKKEDYCTNIEDLTTFFTKEGNFLEGMLNMASGNPESNPITRAIIKALTGGTDPVVSSLGNRFGKWLQRTLKAILKGFDAVTPKLPLIAIFNAPMRLVMHWFGIIPKGIIQQGQQVENMVFQTTMPDQTSANDAFLAGEIDHPVWECWTKINGNVVEAAQKGLDTRRTRPDPLQLSKLLRRKQLKIDEWKKAMREAGVLRESDRERIFDLTQDWPTASELNPWLVRDVWDETTINWKKVDDLFKIKYTGESKKYYDAIGWTEEQAKLHWRAHFHLPSFTMAIEMYHRFRHLPQGHPLFIDEKKLENLLIQDDWHPDWVPYMIAISFTPMRLIDIRSAYDLRTLSDDDLRRKLQERGYNDDTIKLVYEFWKRRREIRDAQKAGFPTVKALINRYANCEIDDGTFRFALSRVVETPEQEQLALQAAEMLRGAEDNKRTIAGVRWQYQRGLISEAEATEHLSRSGIDSRCIPSLVEQFKRQAARQPKQMTASQLCRMREFNIISADDMVVALVRAGWMPLDAGRIAAECTARLTDKAMRKATQESNRIAREMDKQARAEAKRRRELECGPPACPKNRIPTNQNGAAGPTSPGPL